MKKVFCGFCWRTNEANTVEAPQHDIPRWLRDSRDLSDVSIETGLCGLVKKSHEEDPTVWSQSFDKLMRSQEGRKVFLKFLQDENAAENLKFWEECEKYSYETDCQKMLFIAKDIYKTYVKRLSREEVNLPGKYVDDIKKHLSSPTSLLFKESQKYVYSLMQQEKYPRFLKSAYYKSLIETT